jgi:hypothetical protein
LADARKTLGVEVSVWVGSATLTRVSVMTGVETGLLDVGVSSTGAGVDVGTSVGWATCKLQANDPRLNTRTNIPI